MIGWKQINKILNEYSSKSINKEINDWDKMNGQINMEGMLEIYD